MKNISNIYEMIDEIDTVIKRNRLYNIQTIHSGTFNFQEPTSHLYDSFSPYFVDINAVIKEFKSKEKSFKYLSKLGKWGFIDEQENVYSMINTERINNSITGLFLDHGIYFTSCFVSNSHIVFATHSKKLPPQIFETTFNPVKENSTIPFFEYFNILQSTLDFTFQDPQSKEYLLKLEFKENQKPNKHIRDFLKNNPQFSINKEFGDQKFFMRVKSKEQFNFDRFIYCMDETLSMHFFDTDPNIFNRASLVHYIVQHYEDIKSYLPTITEEEKAKLNRVFNPSSQEELNKLFLLPHSIDLNNNKFYSQDKYDHETYDSDYGAEKLKNLINYIHLEMKIKENPTPEITQKHKRAKI